MKSSKTILSQKFWFSFLVLLLSVCITKAQNTFPSSGSAGIGTTTPDAASILEVKSTTQGVLIPRMTKSQRDAIASPPQGLLVYITDKSPGIYYYEGAWKALNKTGANTALSNLVAPTQVNVNLLPVSNNAIDFGSSTLRWKDVNLYNLKFSDGTTQTTAFTPYSPGAGISINGSTIINSAPDQTILLNNGTGISVTGIYPNFTISSTLTGTQWSSNGSSVYYNTGNVGIGTTIPSQLLDVSGNINVNGSSGYFIGGNKILNTKGLDNFFAGAASGNAVTTGYDNAAIGSGALFSITTGGTNTASGFNALYSNTTGNSNTANGWSALYSNTTGVGNSAEGIRALYSNTTGNYNTADGFYAMDVNSTGTYNTAEGYSALLDNTTGNNNTAIGTSALIQNTTGSNNVGLGWTALYSNTTGFSNVAIGFRALASSQTVSNLVGVGDSALYYNTGANNTAVGSKALFSNTTGFDNSAFGYNALYSNTTGYQNDVYGYDALYLNTTGRSNAVFGNSAMYSNTTGYDNTALGGGTLYTSTTGYYNTAVGGGALFYNTTGNQNAATGISALYRNTSGNNNIANGFAAAFSNTTGHSNIAIGMDALYYNQSASNLVAIGDSALMNDITLYNTAVGSKAGYATTSGSYNSYFGYQAGISNTSGLDNSAYGFQALQSTTTGSYNTADGVWALKAITGSYNTGIGLYNLYSNISGNSNTSIGALADVNSSNYSNSSAVGYASSITASNQVRLGNSSVTSIGGYANWSNISDARVKKNIRDNVPGLAFINKLKAVTYNLDLDAADRIIAKPEIKNQDGNPIKRTQEESNARSEKEKIVYSGFMAQDVEKAAKSLGYDFSGVDAPKNDKDLYGLRYGDFVVPLVKAVQELSAKTDSKDATIINQQKEIDELKATLAQLQSSIVNQQSSTSDGFAELKTLNSNLSPAEALAKEGETILSQNIPNPFDNSTLIPFRIPKNCHDASIMIANTSTSEVVSVIPISCNEDHVSIDTGVLASGTYSYTLYVDGKMIDTKKMELVK